MNAPRNASDAPINYLEDLERRKEEGGELTLAERQYCWAIEKGFGNYVADLMYREGRGKELSAGERAYLEAKLAGEEDDEAILLAEAAEEESEEHNSCLTGDWEQAVCDSRDQIFDDQADQSCR